MELIYKDEVYRIVGAAMNVHRELGCGFLEAVYQEAIEIEFQMQQIPYQREEKLKIYYKGQLLKKYYEADFICFNQIVVELKALSVLTTEHESQLLNYLKATDMKLGLLINFGETSLRYKRMIK
ncbi:MAG: GxxExxY protein [Prevotellaceae bacterium]|jgi:GxxExxY protein|nr:GxxExxY protein [Prevotellaceae bacterium]